MSRKKQITRTTFTKEASSEKKFPQVKAKIWYEGRIVSMNATSKTKRLYSKIRAGKFLRIYIKVLYGLQKTNKDRLEMFYNDGTYKDVPSAIQALSAFLES